MKKTWGKPPWYSSYEKNNYGELFYSLIRIYRPSKVVELGTKAGYSAYHIAKALRANKKGRLDCFDLWEKYPYTPVPKSQAQKNLAEFSDIVSLYQINAIEAEKRYQSIDILHVDLSNEPKILEEIIPHWIEKVKNLIIIEGGSWQRDRVFWMKKYHKQPIKKWLQDLIQKRSDLEYFTLEPFPSVTIIRKII